MRGARDPATRTGRVLAALGMAAIAVSRLHRLSAWETPLVMIGAALIVIGLVAVIRARRR